MSCLAQRCTRLAWRAHLMLSADHLLHPVGCTWYSSIWCGWSFRSRCSGNRGWQCRLGQWPQVLKSDRERSHLPADLQIKHRRYVGATYSFQAARDGRSRQFCAFSESVHPLELSCNLRTSTILITVTCQYQIQQMISEVCSSTRR